MPGYCCSGTRKSWVIHSCPSWRVLTNADWLARLTQNSISTVALVSIVRVAATALSAPAMVMMATSPAMTACFMGSSSLAGSRRA